jgi:hypothetical protein
VRDAHRSPCQGGRVLPGENGECGVGPIRRGLRGTQEHRTLVSVRIQLSKNGWFGNQRSRFVREPIAKRNAFVAFPNRSKNGSQWLGNGACSSRPAKAPRGGRYIVPHMALKGNRYFVRNAQQSVEF